MLNIIISISEYYILYMDDEREASSKIALPNCFALKSSTLSRVFTLAELIGW